MIDLPTCCLQILISDFVEGVYIYSRGLDVKSKTTNTLTVLHAGDTSGFIVTGLLPYTRYQFFLIPFYKHIDGRPSNSRTVRTLEDGTLLASLHAMLYVNEMRPFSSKFEEQNSINLPVFD